MSFVCQRCSHAGRYSSWVTARWHSGPTAHRCERCGTAHSCQPGTTPVAIPPPLQGINQAGVLSPWHDARYVPCVIGAFECEWRDGARIRLWWNGVAWTWAGLTVDTSGMTKWRGTWASSS